MRLNDSFNMPFHSYCIKIGIPFNQEAMSWQPKSYDSWTDWSEWHKEAATSSNIYPHEKEELEKKLPETLEEKIKECQEYYDILHDNKLQYRSVLTLIQKETPAKILL